MWHPAYVMRRFNERYHKGIHGIRDMYVYNRRAMGPAFVEGRALPLSRAKS